jgi:hypothetical protein
MQKYSYDTISDSSEVIVAVEGVTLHSNETIFSGVRASFLSGFCKSESKRIYRLKTTASREAL